MYGKRQSELTLCPRMPRKSGPSAGLGRAPRAHEIAVSRPRGAGIEHPLPPHATEL